jgi:hypothetical protein
MLLEKIDAQKKSFTLKFSDKDIVAVMFGADKYGYHEMRVEAARREPSENPNEPDMLIDKFVIQYHWNPELDDAPPFVMDMMAMLHKLGKVNAADEDVENVEDVVEEEVAEEEASEEEVAEEETEEVEEE